MSFELQGHRGARGLFPENTLEGFISTVALGVDAIELDIAVTADRVPVVFHDVALNGDIVRGPDGAWLNGQGPLLRSLTLAALARYDVRAVAAGQSRGGGTSAAGAVRWRPGADIARYVRGDRSGADRCRVENLA